MGAILQWGEPKCPKMLWLAAIIKGPKLRAGTESSCVFVSEGHNIKRHNKGTWYVTSPSDWWFFCQNFGHRDCIIWCWFLQWRLLQILLYKGRGQMVFWHPSVLTVRITQPFNQRLQFSVSVAMVLHQFHEVNVTAVDKGLTSVSWNIFISCFLLIKVVSEIVWFPWTSNTLFATVDHNQIEYDR